MIIKYLQLIAPRRIVAEILSKNLNYSFAYPSIHTTL